MHCVSFNLVAQADEFAPSVRSDQLFRKQQRTLFSVRKERFDVLSEVGSKSGLLKAGSKSRLLKHKLNSSAISNINISELLEL